MAIDSDKFPLENTLEKDIARLSAEIKEIKDRPEFQGSNSREVIKESLKAFTPQKPASAGTVKQDDDTLLPSYMAQAPVDIKLEVEKLIEFALKEGFEPAIKEANKYGGFVIDAFHDALAQKIYPELQKRGLI